MQKSAKVGVLLAVLRRCNVAWKKQQPGRMGALRQPLPSSRRALAASSMRLPFPLESHLRLPLSLPASSGQASTSWKPFLPGTSLQAWLGLPLQGPPRAEPDPLLVPGSQREGLWPKPSRP